MTLIRVRSEGRPGQVAGAIAGEVRRGERVDLQAIGANAVHNAVKAIIGANRFLEQDGLELSCALRYAEVEGDQPLTAVVFAPEARPAAGAGEGLG